MRAEAQRRRFTAHEVLRMVEAGILAEDEPVELIDGELITVSPQGPRHRALTVRIRQRLERAYGPDHHVQDHSPIDAGVDSMPEPDVAVVRGPVEALLDRHPGARELALVVEISVSSHTLDRAKASVYARAGIAEYWQVDVPGRRVVVHTEPVADEYRTTRIFGAEDTLPVPGGTVAVGDLLA